MGLIGGLANVGLIGRGMDLSRQDQNTIEAQRQQNALRGQSIDTGAIGLDTLKRQQATEASGRNAFIQSQAAGSPIGASLIDQSMALARAGDAAGALKARQMADQLRQSGIVALANEYMITNTEQADAAPQAPVPRPDLASLVPGLDPSSVLADNKGNITFVDPTTKQKKTINATTILTLAGKMPKAKVSPIGPSGALIEQGGQFRTQPPLESTTPKVTVVPEGGTGVITGAGSDPRLPANQIKGAPKPSPKPARHVLGEDQRLLDEAGNVIAGPSAGATNVRKDLAVLNDITKGIVLLGEEYGKTDMSNPLNPTITLTPKGQQAALIAEQVRLANQNLAPRTIIDLATKGKPMWKTENGQRTGVVIYNGKEFPMAAPNAGAAPASPIAEQTISPGVNVTPRQPSRSASGIITPLQRANGGKVQRYGLGT